MTILRNIKKRLKDSSAQDDVACGNRCKASPPAGLPACTTNQTNGDMDS